MKTTSPLLTGLSALLTLALGACGSSNPLTADLGSGTPLNPGGPAKACSAAAEAAVQERLRLLAPGALGQFIVTFEGEGPLQLPQLRLLEGLGLSGITLNRLPIAGVLATRSQAEALMALPGVRSVVFNDVLTLEDDVARNLTSVDVAATRTELRNGNGEPITGRGITILVNDSGIDGTHPDLTFGSKTVENVLAHTSLKLLSEAVITPPFLLPHTPTEGVPNTDILGSHGTHVAGIAAGDGSQSDGKFAGAARGANLIGYGSGAAILVLDTLGGFDYALKVLDERPELNLRIVTNSFGNTGDVGTCFNPDDPTNVATKQLADRGVIVIFSAGNAGNGPDTITGNFKKAPWVIIAGNGEKSGLLAPSSSRGSLSNPTYQVEVDGETFTIEDRPTVVTPGTDYIAARAIAVDPFIALDLPADLQDPDLTPEQAVFYTKKTGTSMAAPHLAGLTALLLEANPALTWREVKDIFKKTATNIPGYEPWQIGAGFANAEAALAMALSLRSDYGSTPHALRGFNSVIGLGDATAQTFSIDFQPVGPTGSASFEVPEGVSLVLAQWSQALGDPCTCAIVLTDPAGNRYGSSIALPLLGANVAASAPGMPGTWTISASGIGGLSGVTLDPLGVTNGVAGPSTLDIRVSQFESADPIGLGDIGGHPLQSAIEFAVGKRLVDGLDDGRFAPDQPLTRAQFAEYLMALGVRQTLPHDGSHRFADVSGRVAAIADAMKGEGQLLLDRNIAASPLMPWLDQAFEPAAAVSREQVAYGLVQALGREALTEQYRDVALFAFDADGNAVAVADADGVAPALRNHVQDALALGILKARFVDGPNGREAFVDATLPLSRADYTVAVGAAYATIVFP